MSVPVRPRPVRLLVAAIAVLVAGTGVAACGASAGDLAKASCAKVDEAIALLNKATMSTSPAEAASYRQRAYIDMLEAEPIAAQASYHDYQWETLSATLSEANRVPIASLVPDLRSQCSAVTSSPFGPQTPVTAGAG